MTHEFDDGPPERINSVDEIDYDLLKKGSIRLGKSSRVPSPDEWGHKLELDVTSLPKGANKVYRDQSGRNSLQVREYDDYYLLQMDHANPSEGGLDNIVAHYRLDISPGQKVALVGLAAVAIWFVTRG